MNSSSCGRFIYPFHQGTTSLCNSWASIKGRLRCDRNLSINLVPKLYQIYQISNLLNYLLQFSINSSSTLHIIIMELWFYKLNFLSKTKRNKNSFLFKKKCYLRDNCSPYILVLFWTHGNRCVDSNRFVAVRKICVKGGCLYFASSWDKSAFFLGKSNYEAVDSKN